MCTTTDSDVSIEQPINLRNSCHSIRLLLALPPRTWLKMSKFTSFLRLCTLLRMADLLLFSSSYSTWQHSKENSIHTLNNNNNTKLSCILTHPPRAPFSSLDLSCSLSHPHPRLTSPSYMHPSTFSKPYTDTSPFFQTSPRGAGFSRRECLNQPAPPLSLFSYV